jgi:hypothetical protein
MGLRLRTETNHGPLDDAVTNNENVLPGQGRDRRIDRVKCTLVQALRLCTGRTAHRGSRGIALLYRH